VELGELYMKTGKPVSVKEIARNQELSPQFVANIFHEFMLAGLLKGKKGRNGGVIPARHLSQITVYDLTMVIADPFSGFKCLKEEKSCGLQKRCKTSVFWRGISQEIYRRLQETTIERIILQS
jgi:Rrf2 family protein